MKKKTNKTVVKVSAIKDSRIIFIPKDLNTDLAKGDYVALEVNKDNSITIKGV